jgi:Amt family ammonium transporter
MKFKKSPRAGLVALACLLVAVFLSFSFVNAALAQAPTPAPAAPAAAAPAEAAPPACDGTAKPPVLEKCTPNSGDTAWMLTSMALVLMMTIPGLGLFYGGMVRKKNVGDTVMTSFAITCLVTVLWMICNYSLAFRAGSGFIGGLDRAFLQGILSDISKNIGNPNPLAPTIPETVYMCFQMTFAIITPALIAGAFAERMKFSAMLWFIGLWATLVYAPIAHWVWGPDGFLASGNSDAWVKVLDFAGGTVVHINSGTAGLMAAICLGKRKDTGPGHNMVLTFIGASLLWVGWFGFNAGSAVAANMQAGMAMTVTQIATATAALAWMFVEWAMRGKPTVIGICTGAVAGLVAITPASGFVGPVGSLLIGIAAGVFCYWGCTGLKHMFGYDDALDAFGVHAVGGAVGALLTGVFAIEQYGGTAGLIEGNAAQVFNQIEGIVIVFVYDAVVSLIILKVLDFAIGLRAGADIEREGLDLTLHGEVVQ